MPRTKPTYRCPNCQSDEYLSVRATVDAVLAPDGTLEDMGKNLMFDSSSQAFCGGCGFTGGADKFESQQEEP